MIRINLLGVERHKARAAFAFGPAQRVAAACVVVVLMTAGGVGWWYWSLARASERVDADIAAARSETARLQAIIKDVKAFEARRTQLQQRVALIEQLRRGQSVPVQLLDHVSRSLPEMLWLTSLRQKGGDVTIEGRSTTLIGVSDFVGNLGQTSLLAKPIEIVNSEVESASGTRTAAGAPVELVKFTVKAQLAGSAAPASGADAAGAKGSAGRPR